MTAIGSPENPIPIPRPSPTGTTKLSIEGLGTAKGFLFADGVRQVWGIPYGRVSKRWTVAELAISWEGGVHDGTKYGAACACPPGYDPDDNPTAPVTWLPHLPHAPVNDLESLVMNITTPPEGTPGGPFPLMVFIHGGGFVFGGAEHPGYDCTHLVSYSVARGTPIIAITFSYRVGLSGFLASKDIQADLAKNGHSGAGNFGLLDQQLALEWVQKYAGSVGGDTDNVTIYGESAGGVSIALLCELEQPPVFHRVCLMSGNLSTIVTWPLSKHEARYRALLRYLKIDPDSPDALDRLRDVSEQELCDASIPIEGGPTMNFQNPCSDGVYHADAFWETAGRFPEQVKSVMIGDVRDEGILWREQVQDEVYEYYLEHFSKFMSVEQAETVLTLYGITPDTPQEQLRFRFEELSSDAGFKILNRLCAHNSNKVDTFAYHVDQESTLEDEMKGLAYHAIDICYVFMTCTNIMSEGQRSLSYKMAGHWIDFACGIDPWEKFGVKQRWMVYGPTDQAEMKTEDEDEAVRGYKRMQEIERMGLLNEFHQAFEDAGMMIFKLGTTV